MTKYAQVINNRVEVIVELDEYPTYEIVGEMIDISSVLTTPEEGWEYSNGKFTQPLLIDIKNSALQKVDYTASLKRKMVQKPYFGQDVIYAEKLREATAYMAQGMPDDITEFLWLTLEVEVTNISVDKIAETIISKNNERFVKLMEIEKIRRTGKLNIKNVNSAPRVDEECYKTCAQLDDL